MIEQRPPLSNTTNHVCHDNPAHKVAVDIVQLLFEKFHVTSLKASSLIVISLSCGLAGVFVLLAFFTV